jgi:hypothetical protein
MSDLVSSEDLQFYQQHGWWVSPPLLDAAFLDNLGFGIHRYEAGERDWQLPIDVAEPRISRSEVRQIDYLSLQVQEFRSAIEQQVIVSIAAALANTSQLRLFHDQLVIKPPHDPAVPANVGWHTDKAYWTGCSSDNMITAWIPLEDVPEERGPLAVWDGSHRWAAGVNLHGFTDSDLDGALSQAERQGIDPKILVLPMTRGQISFHHCKLVHGGYANRTHAPRYAYAIHFQDATNVYLNQLSGPKRSAHINDLICRSTPDGKPDYHDPDVFPVLWP